MEKSEEFRKILNNKVNGQLIPTNHESLNSTYFGFSKKFNNSIFIKVFNSFKKFMTEERITCQLSKRILDTFKIDCNGMKYVLVMKDLHPRDLEERINTERAYEMGVVLAKFHNTVKRFDGIKIESNYFNKIPENIKELRDSLEKERLFNLSRKFNNLQPLIENDLKENVNVVLHGDVGVRNYKTINNCLILIDYERARVGINYQDFIKLFYQDFKLDSSLIDSFLNGYNSKSIYHWKINTSTQYFLVFITAIGIMKYTQKIKDKPFKKIGIQMINEIEDYFR
ncbi:phosphotransferase [Lactobacillus sp. PV034]|uniref:phosphotransferase n=1 Tax=Lactobacillus sp. PV034 TaxID=2594495 RepID=UPI00223FA609|nr:phosphotransferase [Lactobacillus sp. PV034]QNQ80312.1 phosphotransferase [Lactobacillus sp. PV034]